MTPEATLLLVISGTACTGLLLGYALAWRSLWLPISVAALLSLWGIWTLIDAQTTQTNWVRSLSQLLLVFAFLAPATAGLVIGGLLRAWRRKRAAIKSKAAPD